MECTRFTVSRPKPGGGYDEIDMQILENGTVKIITDPISNANHTSADALLSDIEKAVGGKNTVTKRTDKTKRKAILLPMEERQGA